MGQAFPTATRPGPNPSRPEGPASRPPPSPHGKASRGLAAFGQPRGRRGAGLGSHPPRRGAHSLTLLLEGRGVQLQVIEAEAGPGRAPHAPELGPADPAPKPHRAVVVLGDDGPAAAACRGAAGQGAAPRCLPAPHLSRDPGTTGWLPKSPSFSLFLSVRSFLRPSEAARGLRAVAGRGRGGYSRRHPQPRPPRVPLTDGATRHAGQDAERGRAVGSSILGPQGGLAATACTQKRLVRRSRPASGLRHPVPTSGPHAAGRGVLRGREGSAPGPQQQPGAWARTAHPRSPGLRPPAPSAVAPVPPQPRTGSAPG